MPLETHAKTIGAYTYTVRQMGSRKATRVLIRLIKIIGIAVGDTLSKDAGAIGKIRDIGLSTIGALVSNVANGISEDDFDFLIDALAPCTDVTGGEYGKGVIPLNQTTELFDMHFAGRLRDMYEWLIFGLEVNYKDFLPQGGIKALMARVVQDQGRQGSGQETGEANEVNE